jgi:putative transposase
MKKRETLDTIWEVPDELWERIEPIIMEKDPAKSRGRRRADSRQMLNGIIFRLRTGCQWNRLPKELGDDSTIHRTLERWVELGVLSRMWAVLIEECEELGNVKWEWQAADGAMGKARFGGT